MSLDIGILKNLHHRYPFVMIDRVLSLDSEEWKIVCQKNLSFNEPFFQGHFPGNPVFPGVLMIEAMAQASSILLKQMSLTYENFYLATVDGFRVKSVCRPGDVLYVESKLMKRKLNFFSADATIYKIEESNRIQISSCSISCVGVN